MSDSNVLILKILKLCWYVVDDNNKVKVHIFIIFLKEIFVLLF